MAERTPTDRIPIPVHELVDHVCGDGSDYDDGVFGWCAGRFDQGSGVLELLFVRDNEGGYELAEDEPDYAGATYRFHLIR